MEIEKAIENLKKQLEQTKIANECGLATKGEFNQDIEAIEFILNYLTKQEKMIELMVNWINHHEDPFEGCHENGKCENELIPCKECIKQYFEKKAEDLIE